MEKVGPKMTVRSTLITTYGLTQNEYSGVFTNVITLDDLFSEKGTIQIFPPILPPTPAHTIPRECAKGVLI